MTVKDLIEELKKLPPDAKVYYEGGEYKDDYREIGKAFYEKNMGWGQSGVLVR